MKRLAHITDRSAQLLGLIGFSSLTVALLVAHANPATGYELSIYASTPLWVWIGIGVAFLMGALIAFLTTNHLYRRFGIVLGGASSFAVISLPVVRGYLFHGIHDSMTHVGVIRELTAGTMTPYESVYPGIHSVAAFIAGFTGLSVWESLMLVPLGTALVFYIFTPLVVRGIVGGETAITVGAFSAFLLVPLHQLAVTIHAHPSSQAILFAPIVLYLVVGYLRSPGAERTLGSLTALTGIVVLTVGATILYHPMQAFNVLLILAAIVFVQLLSSNDRSPWTHRSLIPVLAVSAVLFVAWIGQAPGIVPVLTGTADSLAAYVTGSSSAGAGSAIGSQTASLSAIGSSPVVVFLKLFGVSTLFIIAAGSLVLTVLTRSTDGSVDTDRMIVYLATSLLVMVPVFGVYMFGNVGQYYFRQAGFMMFVVVALGAIAITYGIMALSETKFRVAVGPSVATVFVVLFLLSSLVLFNSPYIHRANQHVTDARVDGYETTFEMTGEDAILNGVMQEPQRYYDAIVSLENNGQRDGTVNSSQMNRLREKAEAGDWHLIISQNTYERELTAYREHRFSRSDFESIDRQIGVNRVFSNGDTELYYVR
ncbi:hypothetical protein [Halapricum desulfuricans]|uniref:Putative membrane protein n=1 Tax=Halapricum desulfuricans TaxID=2841257 RepID=A0A897N9F3_9EURY|nr:hypothetical protein [Halapricum desulfuricans]QSG07763.1 putative membrane protein [Halapricum desulfuricans]